MTTNEPTRILLVDDQEIFRSALCKLLESKLPSAQLVGEAANGREAVRLARELSPDLVIIDPVMRELNGIDALSQMLQLAPALRVIVLSMHADTHHVDEALKRGARGYLQKDSSVAELLAAIAAVGEGKTYLCPRIAELVVRNHICHNGSDNNSTSNAYSSLSGREREVLQLLAEGNTSKEIAAALFIGVKTVETHRSQIMAKLNIRSVAELTKYAVRSGLTSL